MDSQYTHKEYKDEHEKPFKDSDIYVMVLDSSQNILRPDIIKTIHSLGIVQGFVNRKIILAQVIVSYGATEHPENMARLFESVKNTQLCVCNSYILGWSRYFSPYDELEIDVFRKYKSYEILPDKSTYSHALYYCMSKQLVVTAKIIYKSIHAPMEDQKGTLVNILLTNGHFNKALLLMGKTPSKIMLKMLLQGYCVHDNLVCAEAILGKILKASQLESDACVLWNDLHAENLKWEEVYKMKEYMKSQKIKKKHVGISTA